MSVEDGRITKSLLKSTSGEFDLESIHTLNLHELDITDLGCLGECSGLERLDLSRNDITKLHKLAGLASLQVLNLSANRISSLEGLQCLDNLRSVNISGNLIGSVHALQVLTGLEHLKEVRMKDEAAELSNPACMPSSYVSDVMSLLPNLLVLDGHRIRGQGSELFYICQSMDKTLNSFDTSSNVSVPLVDIARQATSVWQLPEKSTLGIQNNPQEQLQDLLTSCHHLSTKAGERLEELRRSLHTGDNASHAADNVLSPS